MQSDTKYKKSSVYLLRLLLLPLLAVAVWTTVQLNESAAIYRELSKRLDQQPVIEKTVQIGQQSLAIPTYELFKEGNVWALISRERPLSDETSHELIAIPVAHGDSDATMKVAREISNELQQLVNAAEADGEPLMVSSAYRSLEEQRAIYDDFVTQYGKTAAETYVLPVGASEHHTGLSVDFSSVSDECGADSDTCSLGQSAAAWLADNAHRFGFIQRYPDGKRSITGVGYEPWHYRFVGKPMAKAIASTDLTYEEVLAEIAPGYAR